jgi:hypothetical protein
MQSPDEDELEPEAQLMSIPTETDVTSYIYALRVISDLSKVPGSSSHTYGICCYSV